MSDRNSFPLILFSGLAADHSVFASQKLVFQQLLVPPWPQPRPNDTLESYSERLADELRQYVPCFIGGASFGGIVALHVARYLNPQGVILIGSVRSPEELPRYARRARWLKSAVPLIPVQLLQGMIHPFTGRWARKSFPHFSSVALQFWRSEPELFKWSLRQILEWNKTPCLDCPVYQIHGSRDHVLPARLTRPDVVIEGGGHVISVTHSKEVNAFLRSVLFAGE